MAVGAHERAELLALARRSVGRALDGLPEPEIEPALQALREPRAAFVPIRRVATGRLRVSAALDDPRFPPVTRAELPALRFEISALTTPEPIRPEEVVVGTHGLLLHGEASLGLLLPQVPVEQGWDREAFLDGLCYKAGVPAGAWRNRDMTLSAFEAEVWTEE